MMLIVPNAPNCPAANTDRETVQFEAGKTYSTRSPCDHNCVVTITVIKRTAKTVTGEVKGKGIKTFRPSLYGNAETLAPWGSFSMCPIITAVVQS